VLKPFYKKYLILRSDNQANNDLVKVCKNRRTLTIDNKMMDSNSIINFSYISSYVDNTLDEPLYYKEQEFLNNEFSHFLLSYLFHVNSIMDQRDIVSLYISTEEKLYLENNFFNVINDVCKKICHFNEYSAELKIVLKNKIIKHSEFQITTKDERNWFSSITLQDSNVVNYSDEMIGILFILKNVKNNSNMKILNLGWKNTSLAFNILTKFNEVNNGKKRKDKSSKKKKTIKENTFIFDELEIQECTYFTTIMDIYTKDLSNQEIKELLFNINT
jgi:hypothetical protein